jgi:ubiquinol-cytochrome c reductase cytochrome b subunit
MLHEVGSSNPLGLRSDLDKAPFHPYYTRKDIVGFIVVLVGLGWVRLSSPWLLGDRENFIAANPLVTPVHIKPEWYFLFAYAILRSIPSKLGGVVALGASIFILWVLPFNKPAALSFSIGPVQKIGFWWLVRVFIVLTWVGGNSVEEPFTTIGQIFRAWYFIWFVI